MKRAVAKKCLIKQLTNSEYIKAAGWEASYVLLGEEKISLVNIMGVVVDAQESMIMLDDGTATIPVRPFSKEHMPKLILGDAVQVIGRIAEHEGLRSIRAEAIAKVHLGWLKVRKHEIQEITSTPKRVIVQEAIPLGINIKDSIIEQIKKKDEGIGVEISSITQGRPEAHKAIQELIRDGEIYEITPGRVRVLE